MASIKPLAIVAGVGAGTGASVARRFAQAYNVVLLARSPANYEPLEQEINSKGAGRALGISTDVGDEKSVADAFKKIEQEFFSKGAGLAAAVYNVGGGFVRKPFLELTVDNFDAGYNSNVRGAVLFSQAVLPHLLASVGKYEYPPTLIFTGATASVKGSANCASFATGKWGKRALSQSLAREFGPKGVHVSHAIIDGVIDIPRTREWKISDFPDAKISSEAIADSYWHLHTQPRSTFTWEIDIRPYVEKW